MIEEGADVSLVIEKIVPIGKYINRIRLPDGKCLMYVVPMFNSIAVSLVLTSRCGMLTFYAESHQVLPSWSASNSCQLRALLGFYGQV